MNQRIIGVNTDLTKFNADVLIHQCNCQGVMGAGIAKQIRNNLLSTAQYSEYQRLCHKYHAGLLGKVQWCPLPDGRRVANLFRQDRYGRDKRYTDYNAVKHAMTEIVRQCTLHGLTTIAVPYHMGCNLAGGNWTIMMSIFYDVIKDSNITLYVCKYA